MIRAVLDTNILVAAQRSGGGASNALLMTAVTGAFRLLASVPLFLEYEAVLTRAEHLLASGMCAEDVVDALDDLASLIEPVRLHYLWRPQLADIADEMVLEAAINGRADCIVTFNIKHFERAAAFGIEVTGPRELLRRVR